MKEYEIIQKKARKRVKIKKGFFIHLGVYVSVGLFFFFMNLATFPEEGEWWFFFPLLPWGAGLLIHYLVTFGFPGTDVLSSKWEEREYEKELERLEMDYYHKGKPTRSGKSEPAEDPENPLELKEYEKLKKYNWDDNDFV